MILRSAAGGQLVKVSQGSGTDPKIVYCRRVKEINRMTQATLFLAFENNREDGHIIRDYETKVFTTRESAAKYCEEQDRFNIHIHHIHHPHDPLPLPWMIEEIQFTN